jgi:hypothetical protein
MTGSSAAFGGAAWFRPTHASHIPTGIREMSRYFYADPERTTTLQAEGHRHQDHLVVGSPLHTVVLTGTKALGYRGRVVATATTHRG